MPTPDQEETDIAVSPRQRYLDFCAAGELAYQYSPSADLAVFYPRTVAPRTGVDDLEWQISAGRGTVYASTTVRPRGEEPHNVSIVELDEGFRMMTSVVDAAPEDVHIGMRVIAEMRPVGDAGTPLPVFVKEQS